MGFPSIFIFDGGICSKQAAYEDNCIRKSAEITGIHFYSIVESLGWDFNDMCKYTDGVHPNNDQGRQLYLDCIGRIIKM